MNPTRSHYRISTKKGIDSNNLSKSGSLRSLVIGLNPGRQKYQRGKTGDQTCLLIFSSYTKVC